MGFAIGFVVIRHKKMIEMPDFAMADFTRCLRMSRRSQDVKTTRPGGIAGEFGSSEAGG